MRVVFQILVLLLVHSCSNTEAEFERVRFIIAEQEVELLTAYELFQNYLNTKGNYSNTIFNPIKNEFAENTEYPFMFKSIEGIIKPDESLSEYIEVLQQTDIAKIVESSFHQIISELPGSKTRILIIPANPEYVDFFRKYKIGVIAITVGSGKIIVSIDPMADNWKEQLPYVLAHEYHHSVWTSRNFKTKDFTPLEYLIFEGRADCFAKRLFPDVTIPWINMITKDQEKIVWDIIKPELNKRETEMNDLMMIGNDKIPYSSGYTIGYNIVNEFKKHNPTIDDKTLIDMDSEIILSLSQYGE